MYNRDKHVRAYIDAIVNSVSKHLDMHGMDVRVPIQKESFTDWEKAHVMYQVKCHLLLMGYDIDIVYERTDTIFSFYIVKLMHNQPKH